jgi:hypothetical protein
MLLTYIYPSVHPQINNLQNVAGEEPKKWSLTNPQFKKLKAFNTLHRL